jgi:putative addiction module CopG family antidote
MAKEVAAKVASGEYASESEVIRDGLRALQARDKAMEQWLNGEVAGIYDRMQAEPARARSAVDVKASLVRARERKSKPA